MKKKMLLVGWDAADWQIINPLVRQGKLPALAKLIAKGAQGNLVTLDPPISPMLWTSIATGKRPYKHGIHGFTEADEKTDKVRPVRVSSRKCKALWNILNEHNLKTNVIGWWPSHPAEPLNGCCVSNFYGITPDEQKEDWPLLPDAVHPSDFASQLASLRVHPKELSPEMLRPFFPEVDYLNSDDDAVLRSVMRILAHASSVHSAATYVMENTDWDFTAVYYDALDHFSHLGMKYHPPQLAGVSDTDFKKYHYIVEGAYRFHDMMLERLLDLAGDDCEVMLVSDHGFINDQKRLLQLPEGPGAPALEHRPYGIILAAGPTVNPGSIYGASLLDVTPSILQFFNLPLASDMDGRMLNLFKELSDTTPIDTYESEALTSQAQNPGKSTQIDDELLNQLNELGYIDLPADTKDHKLLLTENQYYLARSLADGGLIEEAIKTMNPIVNAYSEIGRYQHFYAGLLLRNGNAAELSQWLEKAVEGPFKTYLTGITYLKQGKVQLAISHVKSLAESGNDSIRLMLAQAMSQAGETAEARKWCKRVLEADEDNMHALNMLGSFAINDEAWEEAISYLFKSLKLFYYQPQVHEQVGICLYWLAYYSDAAQAFEIALQFNPQKASVKAMLVDIYTNNSLNEKRLVELNTNDEIKPAIVVTGFPRSGTSMMMQMLHAADVPILKDNKRLADEHNQQGYLEFEAVKKTHIDQSYMKEAGGKAVKIVMPLVRLINPVIPLKIIWLERSLHSVIKSQEKMKGAINSNVSLSLISKMNNEISAMGEWLNRYPHISYLKLKYEDVLSDPIKASKAILGFLQIDADPAKMASVVDARYNHWK